MMKQFMFLLLLMLTARWSVAENGYDLWLRYKPVANKNMLTSYKLAITEILLENKSQTSAIIQDELKRGLESMLGTKITFTSTVKKEGTIIIAGASSPLIGKTNIGKDLLKIGSEGYIISTQPINGKKCIIISGNTDVALLYGSFHFLRLLQTQETINNL
ncbi:MAG TPA: alpha-glucuronidase family glycosyl hydrolase, partial [Chitinophagaceae bacterium]